MPGPGNYNPLESGRAKPPAYTMRPKTSSLSDLNKSPGPGAYNPKFDVSKENLGACKIGTGTRDAGKNIPGGKEVPGPGAYAPRTSLGGPAFGIGSSMRDEVNPKSLGTPGPGHYKVPTYIANLPKYTMPDRPESLRYL